MIVGDFTKNEFTLDRWFNAQTILFDQGSRCDWGDTSVHHIKIEPKGVVALMNPKFYKITHTSYGNDVRHTEFDIVNFERDDGQWARDKILSSAHCFDAFLNTDSMNEFQYEFSRNGKGYCDSLAWHGMYSRFWVKYLTARPSYSSYSISSSPVYITVTCTIIPYSEIIKVVKAYDVSQGGQQQPCDARCLNQKSKKITLDIRYGDWSKLDVSARLAKCRELAFQCLDQWCTTFWQITSKFNICTPLITPIGDDMMHKIGKPAITKVQRWITLHQPGWEQDEFYFQNATFPAVQNATAIDINSIAMCKDLIELKDFILSTIQLLRGKVTPKSIADLYLSTKYGWKLLISDLLEIHETLEVETEKLRTSTHPWQRSRGRAHADQNPYWHKYSAEYSVKLVYEDPESKFLSFLKDMMASDFWPTTGNVWDMIPFSFVVDWFIPLGDKFELLDAWQYYQYLKILGTTESVKRVFSDIHPSYFSDYETDWKAGGFYELTQYKRRTKKSCRQPNPNYYTGEKTFSNWVDAGMLILQRFK